MLINELYEIESIYKIYGENTLNSPPILKKLEKPTFEFLLSLLYELKDYGTEIDENSNMLFLKSKILELDDSRKSFLISLYNKYYILNSLSDYLALYKKLKLNHTETQIEKIFSVFSSGHFFECISNLIIAFNNDDKTNIFYTEALTREISEVYNMFYELGVDSNLMPLKCAYISIDQINNLDFINNFFLYIYFWCKKNA